MANYGDLMLGGKSGYQYHFRTCPFDTRFRPVGAVYFVTKRIFRNGTFRRASHEVIYIGQTDNLLDTFENLPQREAIETHGANCVCVCPVLDEAQRVAMVDDLLAGGHRPLLRM